MGDATDRATTDAAYDVVVVGAGAAGLSAALVLARARRRVAVVDAGEPRNASATHVQGFLTRDGMAPADLLAAGRTEVAGYGGELIEGRVDRIVQHIDSRFAVQLASAGGSALEARRVLLATGLRDELPDIPGVAERWGRDLLHCPYCHGYEVRDQPIGVLGTHPMAVHQALLLGQWSGEVVLFTHTLSLSDDQHEQLAARGVRLVDGVVSRLVVDDDRLCGVEVAEGQVVATGAVFIFPRMVPLDSLLIGLGCVQDGGGWVTTDPSGQTSVAGVWAVGNVADARAQVITAASMGSTAAFAINQDLVIEEVARAVEVHRGVNTDEP